MKNTKPIKLMVVDDHPAFRIGLIALIESEPDMKVVAETGNGREVLEIFRRAQPDVVLMDLRLPGISGVEAIIALRKEFPECRVIVITIYDHKSPVITTTTTTGCEDRMIRFGFGFLQSVQPEGFAQTRSHSKSVAIETS